MKRIAIMQPYFFPYIGYFSLIKHVDEFMLFDTPQFIRHGWIERNRVLKQNEGWLYVKVPLKKQPQTTPINKMTINETKDWRSTILAQLQPYKKIAPYFVDVELLLRKALANDAVTISDLNEICLREVCDYLGIKTPITVFSRQSLELEPIHAPDEWALAICKARGDINEYWNPPGGKSFFDKNKYDEAGIDLKFHEVHLHEYDQKRKPFEAGLSIIDVIMFNSPETVNAMLDDYEAT